MKLLPKQENAVYYLKDNVTKELIYGGAAGGGKSAFIALKLIENCQLYAGSRWLLGRSKLKALKETTLNTFFDESAKLGVSEQWEYNQQSGVIKWLNGSEIILKDLFLYPSDPNFDSLGSLEITGSFIDECNQVVYKAWQVCLSRCRYKLTKWDIHGELTENMKVLEYNADNVPILWLNSKGEKTRGLIPKQVGTCNPAKNWTYKEFYKKDQNGTLAETKKFIKALPTDNPYLPKSYLDSLLSLDKNSRERLYYGNWEYDNDPASLIDYEAIQDYFNPIHVEKTGVFYISVDVARKGKDSTVFRVWNGYLVIKRIAIGKTLVTEVADKVKQLQKEYLVPISNVVIDEDGVGGGVVDILQGCKGFVNNSKALNNENFANLKSQCSIGMAKLIQSRKVGELTTDRDVIDIITEEMEQVKIKDLYKDGKVSIIGKDVMKDNIGRSPDDWDSIMMRYIFELQDDFFTF